MNLWRRLWWWFNRRQHQADLAEEVSLHEELKQRELEVSGLSPEAAVVGRRRAMGNTTWMREEARGIWIWPWLDQAEQDVRFALRSARRSPVFSVGVIAITALGIGATTTIFSVVDGVLLRGLPYPAADRLVYFDQGSHATPIYQNWQREITSFDRWAAGSSGTQDLTGAGRPERLNSAEITPGFFELFGAKAAVGRLFSEGDFRGPATAVVLSRGLWRRRFGEDSSVVGRTIELGGRRVVVAGVLADGFVEPEQIVARPTDVWSPLDLALPENQDRHKWFLNVVGRLREGVTIAAARQELGLAAPRLAKLDGELHADRTGQPNPIPVLPLQRAIVQGVDRALVTLLAAVGLMLLVACANVVNLYLARSTDRFREMAVRAAIGAGRGRLARQLVTESLTLGIVAGLLGTGLAMVGVRALAGLYPGELPRAGDVRVDGRVLAFALGASIVTGLLFGLVPAWALGRRRVQESIGRTRGRLRAALVIAEVALALVLVIGSGLLFHSFLRIIQVDPGFDPRGVVVAQLELGDGFTGERRLAMASAVEERLRGLPGVTEVSSGVVSPMGRSGSGRCCWRQDDFRHPDGSAIAGAALIHPVGARYFAAIGARLEGSEFTEDEVYADPYPAIVSASFAERAFGAGAPLGKRFSMGKQSFEIRGVVSGLRQWGLDQDAEAEVYLPYRAFGGDFGRLAFVVRASGDAAVLVPTIRQAIWTVEPSMPADDVRTMAELVRVSLAGPRFYGTLMGTFGLLALVLAAGGIYASMLYSVRQRTRELGIRLALGAERGQILGMIIKEAGWLGAIGLVIGGVASAGLTRLLSAFLFGISPSDPVTFGAAFGILAATVLVAAYLPARRAGRSDPVSVLRAE